MAAFTLHMRVRKRKASNPTDLIVDLIEERVDSLGHVVVDEMLVVDDGLVAAEPEQVNEQARAKAQKEKKEKRAACESTHCSRRTFEVARMLCCPYFWVECFVSGMLTSRSRIRWEV